MWQTGSRTHVLWVHDWGPYHSSEKVSCGEWYWNPSPNISGYMCGSYCAQHRVWLRNGRLDRRSLMSACLTSKQRCGRLILVSAVVGCKIPRKENSPIFVFLRPFPSCFPGFTRGWPDDWSKQALQIKKIGLIKTFSRVYPKKASTRRVNKKIADFTRNRRVLFSRYLAANYVVSDWWCCRVGAVESSSVVVAGEVVPNRRITHHWPYHTLGYRGGYSEHHGTRAGIPREGGPRPPTKGVVVWVSGVLVTGVFM